mmetsp:Transcript_19632/g.39989  ORF Transcript_19632/g.39989 Transcript_19632/m.39989 type:complete len:201 (-) Transcript_19632:811-1413(-)
MPQMCPVEGSRTTHAPLSLCRGDAADKPCGGVADDRAGLNLHEAVLEVRQAGDVLDRTLRGEVGVRRRARLDAVADGRAEHASHGHGRSALEDEAVHRLAGPFSDLRQVRREAPLVADEDGVVGREAQVLGQLDELRAAARAGGADEAEDLGLRAVGAEHAVALRQVRHALLATLGHPHEGAAVQAHSGGVVVGGHADGC